MYRITFIGLFCALAASAQVATLTGRITDQTGAVVPGAEVKARSADTGIEAATTSNSEGYYTLPSLQPGQYEVSITKQGFVPVKQTGLELTVQQVARLDLTLKVGSLSETVEVRAQTQLLDSESSTLGQVIGNKQVTELPLLGRNTYALAMLVPGVRPSGGVNNVVIDQISTVAYSINGQRASANEFLLDGAPNSTSSQNQPVINANPDMVQEFKVETNSFSAEYGRAAGGVFNVVTRSGTNDLHFTAYEFFRHEKLSDNDYFAKLSNTAKAPFRFNQFGGTVGGPVYIPKLYDGRNRTFFFFNTELVRFTQGITFTAVTPEESQLRGDFSNARLPDGRLVNIFDPATTTAVAGGFTRTIFPGNVIPANRIDPVASKVSALLPRPMQAGQPLGRINYTRTGGNRVPKDTVSIRGDHNFTAANRLFVRYSRDNTPLYRALAYGEELKSSSPTAGPQVFTRWNAVVEDSHTFSPSLLGTFRYSVTRLVNNRRPYSDGFDVTSIGLPSYMIGGMVDPISLPAINITGLSRTGSVPNTVVGGFIGATDLINFGPTTHSVQGSLTKTLSSHTLKFGAEYRVIQLNAQQTGDQATVFNFTPNWTQGPNPTVSSTTAGLGLATFLLGIPGGGVTPAPSLAMTTKYAGFFVQDSWKVTSKLTVNWGLRYEYEGARTDRFNQLTNFDYGVASPLKAEGLNPRGGLTFAGVGGLPRNNANPDRNNWAPRAGIAWRVLPKTVIRTGGGLFYAATTGIGGAAGAFGVSGFQASTSITTSLDGVTPIVKWSDPYPQGFNRPTGSSLGLSTLAGQSIGFFDRGNYVPSSAQWSFSIQQELPYNTLFEIGYAGSRGVGFQQNRVWNQLPDSALSLGNALRDQVTNPFFGQIAVGALSQPRVARAQLLRPFPHFDAVTSQNASWASSNYNAMEVKVEKRYASGVSAMVAYTWSKLFDYGVGPFAGEVLGADGFQNNNDLASEWGVSTTDQTHRLLFNAVYELPFFKNNRSAVGRLLGGWQVGGIWSAFSGGPLGISSQTNNTFSQGGGQRPNWNGQNPCVANPTATNWLDASVFSNPPAYAFGNAPSNYNGCRADSTSQVDVNFAKTTPIRDRLSLQFRAEIYNITNAVTFAPPNQVFGNVQFGTVNAQGNLPRIIQFGLKLIY